MFSIADAGAVGALARYSWLTRRRDERGEVGHPIALIIGAGIAIIAMIATGAFLYLKLGQAQKNVPDPVPPSISAPPNT